MADVARGLAAVLLMGVALGSAAGEEPPAQVLVRQTTDKVLAILEEQKAEIEKNPARVYDLVDDYVLPHFDFHKMSRRALGKHWRNATPEQRERFVQQFQTLLVRTYAIALAQYSDEKVGYLAPRERSNGSQISVRTQIIQSGGPAIPINYEMYRKGDEWKVFDVAIDGVSLVINYRSTFSSEVRQKGLDALIERLREHNDKKAQGSG